MNEYTDLIIIDSEDEELLCDKKATKEEREFMKPDGQEGD